MLELRNIKKNYPIGGGVVEALKGISLQFRRSEFVSILGPSGCGKTTLLNIIGGLDQYTEGDLIINGRSTKGFKDRDWDSYRNHSVGFVFQSYNLIPHQTVLQNVELALTLSGVSRAERKARAVRALEEVGLGNQLNKRPSEMSGGQMQRVAIARALVNNPDIILADEPTGALDTETSVQVMELLKKISSDRLIVMVTHNPELAQRYSSRIIRVLDGRITGDSAPLSEEELNAERAADQAANEKAVREKKPSMSFPTAFMLSLKNLCTKKGRTALTAFAGSIGIIGIALIFSVSQGMTSYIELTQKNTLSSYPLSIQAASVDLTSLMQTFMDLSSDTAEHPLDQVYERPALQEMVSAMNNLETTENDLVSFKAYLDRQMAEEQSALAGAISGIQYAYDLDLQIYTKNVDGVIQKSDAADLMRELLGSAMGAQLPTADSSAAASMGMGAGISVVWQELLPGRNGEAVNDLITSQYDLIYGSWPNSYNELVLVVDENNELDDMTLYALGLIPEEAMQAVADGEDPIGHQDQWSYEELCGMDFRAILSADCYRLDEATGLYSDLRETEAGLRYLYDNALNLNVTGIIRKKADSQTNILAGSICYPASLTEYLMGKGDGAEVVQAQMEDPSTDLLTGLPFASNTGSLSAAEKEEELRAYLEGLDETGKADAFVTVSSLPDPAMTEEQVSAALEGVTREEMEQTLAAMLGQQMSVSQSELEEYLAGMDDEALKENFSQLLTAQFEAQYAAQAAARLALLPAAQKAAALGAAMEDWTADEWDRYYDELMVFSDSSYEENLRAMGWVDRDAPSAIHLYSASFEDKDLVKASIDQYNEGVDEVQQIRYTDYVGLMMSAVTSIIDAITYVLVAFVGISLVVSSIMIGVITLISVQERTKEIGILRAIGASKRDVSSMFNAETVIIGFGAGLLGVAVTVLLCIPINAILHQVTGIGSLNAYLPWQVGAVLVGISVLLTLIAGVIPSRSAARKDPVVALRSE